MLRGPEEAEQDPEVRPVQEPWGGVVSEGPQEVLPLERLSVCKLSAGGREAEGDGCTGGAEEAAGH